MMWIAGVPATTLLKAFIGVVGCFSGLTAQVQHKMQPIMAVSSERNELDGGMLVIVAISIILTIAGRIMGRNLARQSG